MAIIKSPVWSEVRGSVGGTTYARNKAGQYARNRSKPVNPNTARQSFVRSLFSSNAGAFSNLSVDDVAAWNQFAQGYPAINKVGDTYTPSGKQMFIMCNQNLATIGIGGITTPPYDIPIVPGIDISAVLVTLENTAGALSGFDVEGIGSNLATAQIVLQATPNMQPARQSYRNRMRQLQKGLQGTSYDLVTNFNDYFGNPAITTGQIINLRASAVDPASGVASAWMYFQAVIPAPGP